MAIRSIIRRPAGEHRAFKRVDNGLHGALKSVFRSQLQRKPRWNMWHKPATVFDEREAATAAQLRRPAARDVRLVIYDRSRDQGIRREGQEAIWGKSRETDNGTS